MKGEQNIYNKKEMTNKNIFRTMRVTFKYEYKYRLKVIVEDSMSSSVSQSVSAHLTLRTWPFECQKIAKKLQFFQKNCQELSFFPQKLPMAI